MSRWEEQVRTHRVQGTFATVLASLEGLDPELAAQAPDDIERLLWVVGHVQERLNRTPAMAVPSQTLEQLHQHLTQLNAELTNAVSTGQVSYFGNANTQADGLLEQARVLPPLPVDGVAAEAGAYLERVSGMVSTVVGDAEKDRERLQDAADGLDARLVSAARQLDTLEAGTATQAAKLDQALADQKTQFNADEADRAAAFRDAEDDRTREAEATAQKATETFGAAAAELSDSAGVTLQELAALKQKAEEVVGAIGVAGVANGYNTTANHEEKSANRLRTATVVIALLAAGVLVVALILDHATDSSWRGLATRLLLSLSLAGVAAYCGRESSAHRAVAREARARHLQLAAFNPYLADMPEEERVRLKGELASVWFAATPTAAPARAPDEDGSPDPQAIAKVMELLNTLATKGAGR